MWLLENHGLEVYVLVLEGGLGIDFVLVQPPDRKLRKTSLELELNPKKKMYVCVCMRVSACLS
jgi:hypothetical protein